MDLPDPFRVLCVDDEHMIGELVGQILHTQLGCEVKTATDGIEALDLLRNAEFQVILADYLMPRMDGGELYRRLVSDHPELASRVMFMTGDTLSETTLKDIESTGRLLLKKPFGLDELTDAVSFMLARAVPQGGIYQPRAAG